MIPILFEANSTSFDSMGLGVLALTTNAIVKRVLNGKDELELTYPINGPHFSELTNTRIILAQPEYQKDPQPYRIYKIGKPMKGLVTVYARHISEQRSYTIVEPFSADSIVGALAILPSKIVGDNPFTFYTDKTTVAHFEKNAPTSLGNILGGEAGSFLDVFGGEYEFNVYQIRILNRRGVDRGVSVEYAKNLTSLELTQAVDETVITSICPVWHGAEENDVMFLPDYIIDSEYVNAYPYRRAMVVDFSDAFEEKPTEQELRQKATSYINKSGIGVPNLSIKVSFEHLAQYEEYKGFAVLETLNLGDSVSIHHADLGVDINSRVIETNYNVLVEKYVSVTVGKMQSNMSTTLGGIDSTIEKKARESRNYIGEAVSSATDMITGVNGGYVVMNHDADGKPYEILIMDTPDKATATNVIRMNQNGIGFSKTGYNGPFTTAWTIDGAFVANFITAGEMSGNRVRTGLIQSTNGNSYWNLDTGEFFNSGLSDTLDNMQAQIDDAIETFTGSAVPTLNNYPASGWTTTQEKDLHIGDLYVVNSEGGDEAGFYYRFEKVENTYQWSLLKDTDVTKALADAEAAKRIAEAAAGDVAESVKEADVEYYKSTSATALQGGSWSTSAPTWQEGYYIWIRTKWTQNDGTETYSPASCLTGNTGAKGDKGDKGDTGVSITQVTNYYLATNASSGVTPSTSGWTTTIQSMTASKQYLWNYEQVQGSNGQVLSTTTPCIIGRFGKDGTNGTNGTNGRGIVSIVEHYAVSPSDTTPPSTWSDTMVTTTPTDRYLWNYETITYTDNTTEDTTKRIIGTHGATGESAVVYYIESTADAIVKSESGTFTPASVTFSAWCTTGAANPANYSGRFIIAESTNGTAWANKYTSSANESSKTYTPSSTSVKLIRCTLYLAGGTTTVVDVQTVAVVSDGIDGQDGQDGAPGTNGRDGTNGTDGQDAYTVILTNENHTFAGSETAAIAGSTTCNIVAYKGATQVAATIGTISGKPTGMTSSITNNGTTNAYFTVTVTTSMVTRNGVLTVPVTVDGKTFNMKFTYSLALKGDKGEDGVSITSVTNYYLATSASSGVTPSTSGWTTTIQNITASKPYLWNYEVTTGSDGNTISTTTPCIIGRFGKDGTNGTNGTNGQDGRGITSITEYYAVSASDSTPPSSWSTTMVTTDPTNKYLWNYETVSYTDGTTEDTIKRIIGTHGIDGTNGKGIASITEYYAINNSTTAPADSAFSTTVAAPTEAKRYLWNYELFTYTDGTTSKTNKHIMAVYGQKGDTGAAGTNGTNGVGISSVTEYYAATSSTTAPADSAFSTTVATMTETNKYLWNYELITYTDTTTERTAKRIIGVYGATGPAGQDGQDGQDGDDGIGIVSVTELYYCSNSASAPAKPTAHVTVDSATEYNKWNKACPTWTTTYKYYYTCVEILWTDNTYGWSDVVSNNALTLANDNANTAIANTPIVNILPSVYYRENETGKVYTSGGITWTVNANGSVTATGTATASNAYVICGNTLTQSVPLIRIDPTKKYYMSGCPEGGSSSTYYMRARTYNDAAAQVRATAGSDYGSGSQLTIDATATNLYVWLQVVNGTALPEGGITFYPQIEVGNVKHAYVSTHGGTGAVTAKAIKATVSCYYRSSTNTAPAINTSTTIGTADNTDNTWSYVIQKPKNGTYFYTCERYTYADGSVGFSAVRPMSNFTASSLWCSANDATLINGAKIYTGSITAAQIQAGTITGDKLNMQDVFSQSITATDLTITGGSIQIDTNDSQYDAFILNYTSALGFLKTEVKPGSVTVSRDETSVSLDADGIRFMTGNQQTGWMPAAGIKFIDLNVDGVTVSGSGSEHDDAIPTAIDTVLTARVSDISVNTLVIVRAIVNATASGSGNQITYYRTILISRQSNTSINGQYLPVGVAGYIMNIYWNNNLNAFRHIRYAL